MIGEAATFFQNSLPQILAAVPFAFEASSLTNFYFARQQDRQLRRLRARESQFRKDSSFSWISPHLMSSATVV